MFHVLSVQRIFNNNNVFGKHVGLEGADFPQKKIVSELTSSLFVDSIVRDDLLCSRFFFSMHFLAPDDRIWSSRLTADRESVEFSCSNLISGTRICFCIDRYPSNLGYQIWKPVGIHCIRYRGRWMQLAMALIVLSKCRPACILSQW